MGCRRTPVIILSYGNTVKRAGVPLRLRKIGPKKTSARYLNIYARQTADGENSKATAGAFGPPPSLPSAHRSPPTGVLIIFVIFPSVFHTRGVKFVSDNARELI